MIRLFIFLTVIFFSNAIIAKDPKDANYAKDESLTTKDVGRLLQEASFIYNSPERVRKPGMAQKTADNMAAVIEKLKAAFKLAPWRADLLFSQASAYIHLNDVDKAICIYQQILLIAPQDIDALTYLSVWRHMQGNLNAQQNSMDQLKTLSSERESEVRRLLHTIDRILISPWQDEIPAPQQRTDKLAIVTMGYALNADGSMHSVLVARLEKTLQLAQKFPQAILIVTGGAPKNNRTEAQAMTQWLIKHGVNNRRIFADHYSTSTVQNALFARYILSQQKIKRALIVTSPGHLRRSKLLFTLASRQTGPRNIEYLSVADSEKAQETNRQTSPIEKIFLYRDALKVIGLRSFRSAPLEEL
ncbi:hypothetical protein BTJ39_05735 [Izhakiella australiensis]|uniref:DUF218 domain-containing protein n=1 Tax=Izhakiella australiensis TaxID=1926881 RepID=A0A1S8YRP2_9GAMM|nr:YdcF family protein [Izhakiella australiensis]OON41457.1 hypothetical protein BTJ39_05735 [Izhakiella australiensis]